jgi:protein-tyrosine phosphatase
MAATMARALVEQHTPIQPVVVESAGVHASVGEATECAVLQVLAARGLDVAAHPARQLTVDMLARADLVLTAEQSHRASVLHLRPDALGHTFTLLELARILGEVGVSASRGGPQADRTRAAIRAAFQLRATVPRGEPGEDDMPDPYGKQVQAFERCAYATAAALEKILSVLFQPTT